IIANVFGDKMSNSSSFLTWIDLDAISHPWMLYVIFSVMAAVACGISLWLIIRRHKSSKI
ncbi:MAG: hypothetical protein K2N14_04995, partial [Clostridia bacterium]|nr:hypothetical protein [Clostridia bacterium]